MSAVTQSAGGSKMRRREFIAGVAGSAMWSLSAPGQVRARVGWIIPYRENDEAARARYIVFQQELARLGWTEGRDLQLDARWTSDKMDRVRAEAADLVRSRPDVIA